MKRIYNNEYICTALSHNAVANTCINILRAFIRCEIIRKKVLDSKSYTYNCILVNFCIRSFTIHQ